MKFGGAFTPLNDVSDSVTATPPNIAGNMSVCIYHISLPGIMFSPL